MMRWIIITLGLLGAFEIIFVVPGIQLFPSLACSVLIAIGIWAEDFDL